MLLIGKKNTEVIFSENMNIFGLNGLRKNLFKLNRYHEKRDMSLQQLQ